MSHFLSPPVVQPKVSTTMPIHCSTLPCFAYFIPRLSLSTGRSQKFPTSSSITLCANISNSEKAYIFQPSHFNSYRTAQSPPSETIMAPLSPAVNPSSPLRFDSHEKFLEALYAITDDPLQPDGGRIVGHRGSPQARLMLIGEAPGEQEDVEGRPFVGRAGLLLDKIFEYGGFDMSRQIYITNVAKRRPSNNRTPTFEEATYYMPYLREEIRLVDPLIIVLAGRLATNLLLDPSFKITKVRGKWFGGDQSPYIMPIFHPAYLLRNPRAKFHMLTDIEEIRAKYIHLFPEDPLNPLIKNRS